MRFHARGEGGLTPEQRAVVEAVVSGPRRAVVGDVDLDTLPLGPLEALLVDPELALRVQALGERVRFSATLPPALRELAVLLVARHWRSAYEWKVHHPLALREGVPAEVAEALRRGEHPALDPDSEVVASFVASLLATGRVGDEAFAAVVERWGERGALDLVALVGYYGFLAFVLNVDQYQEPGDTDPFATA